MTTTPAKSPSDFTKEEVFIELYKEYESCFVLSQMFGWKFEEKSKVLIEGIQERASKVFGFTPTEFSEWVERQPRETVHGTIPVPDFSRIF